MAVAACSQHKQVALGIHDTKLLPRSSCCHCSQGVQHVSHAAEPRQTALRLQLRRKTHRSNATITLVTTEIALRDTTDSKPNIQVPQPGHATAGAKDWTITPETPACYTV